MAVRSLSETKRVRYLLGLCSPAEREHIELQYFEDEDAFQEMLTAEDDLIDAYARGELTDDERQRFEHRFVSSSRGRKRVGFARAFAGIVSNTGSVESRLPPTLLFRPSQSFGLPWTATIAVVIVFVALLALLISDRSRMSNELRVLRTESAELSKRTEELQRSSDSERRRTAEIAAQLADLRAQPDTSRVRERGTSVAQRVRHSLPVENDREQIASSKPDQTERAINTEDAVLGNNFVARKITELPVNTSNVANLLSLQAATTRDGKVAEGRADQANVALDGVSREPLNTFLLPQEGNGSGDTAIRISSSLRWIRFQVTLESAAVYEDYCITIKTADGHPIHSVNWIEPLMPNQTIIDTPAISTDDLSSNDYVLLLTGKEPDGSFVKVAEYSFKVIKY